MRAPVRRFRFGVQQEFAATGAQWLNGAREAEDLGFDSLLCRIISGSSSVPWPG